jgi:hypothetical protein
VAYKAEINVDVRNLNKVSELEAKLSNISRSVNTLNRGAGGGRGGRRGGGGGGSAKSELSEEQKLIQLENKRLRIQNQGLGVTRKALDLELKGQKLAEATNNLAQVETLTEQDQLDLAKNKILLADQEVKKKGLLLKAEQAINAEVSKGQQIKSTGLTAGDRVGLLGLSGKANRLAGKAEGVISADKQKAINAKLLPSTEMLRPAVRGIKELDKNVRNLGKVSKITGKNVQFLASQYGPQEPGIFQPPQGPFSRLSDRQSRDETGRRTRLNNPIGGLATRLGARRGFDFGSAAISGGFPLLFGQGPGVAAAGALGGGIGGMFGQMGGFAGGIAATAAVQSIQNVITGIGQLGTAMNRLNPNISAMSQAMGIAGTVEEKRLQLIEQNLGKQAAYNAALEMLGEKIGADKAEELRKFGQTFQRLGNEVTLFFTKVQAVIAKLLNKALDAGADANLRGRARTLVSQNPNNAAFRDINKQIADLEAQRSGAGRKAAKDLTNQINNLKQQRLEIAETIILEKDKDKLRVKTNKLITAGLADLTKENELNKAIIAGNEEEFRIKQAVKDKVDEMGLSMEELLPLQLERIKNDITTNKNLKEQAELTTKVNDAFESINQTIRNDVKEGIRGLIKGTSTLGDMLNNVADRFLDLALNQALFGNATGEFTKGKGGGIFGAIAGMFANGGRPPVGRPSIVGERGPELFVPRTSGTIVPNNKLGGGNNTSVVVNVDASGSDVEGDEAGAKELGGLISIAVQSELVRQQRPGGLLSSIR